MASKPGRPPGLPKTGGRKPGTPNKVTSDIKAAIFGAFDRLGGIEYLEKVGREDPRTFCGLLGKVMPTQITTDGAGGITITLQTGDAARRQQAADKAAAESQQD